MRCWQDLVMVMEVSLMVQIMLKPMILIRLVFLTNLCGMMK